MQCNEKVNGFTVTRICPVAEQEGTLYEFTHDRTGAKLAWLSRQEENKSFCIAFATIPDNDCGMFHILEHSVLNGSERYPVKAPFVELMKSSMQTFLNAMTYPDRTVYPVASRNEKDFENLVRIYMDAVLHPRIYDCPEIFCQEGWHYEPKNQGEGYVRNGVVLNEMRGAHSSVDTMMVGELMRLLYPDTCYRYESGGHPDAIPELTYEQFVNYHRTYYHPSNAHIFLDGDLPIERLLKLLDEEYLSAYEAREMDTEIPLQGKTELKEAVIPYPAVPGMPKEQAAQLVFGCLAGRYDEKEKLYAANMLASYLAGDNDAPLTRAILEKGLAQDVEAVLYDGIKQPAWIVIIRNADEARAEEIKVVFRDVLQKLMDEGLDRERMISVINNMEFHVREQEYGWMPGGIGLALNLMGSWLYGEDPMESFENSRVFAALRAKMDQGYFEILAEEMILNSENQAWMLLTPSETIASENQRREQEEIDRITGAWTEEEKQSVEDRLESLRRRQTTPDTPEQLASIPILELSDVETEPGRIPTKQSVEDGLTILSHPLPTRGIRYLTLYFPLPKLDRSDLPKVTLLARLLGELGTEHYDPEALKLKLKSDLGRISFGVRHIPDREDTGRCRAYMTAELSVLEENTEKAAEYLEEILLHTQFAEENRIRDILAQNTEMMRQGIIGAGHQFAMLHAGAHTSAAGAAEEYSRGYTYYRWMQETLESFENEGESLAEELGILCGRIFTRGNLIISMTGEEDETLAGRLWKTFPEGEPKPQYTTYIPLAFAKEGIEIPAEVAYAVQSANLTGLGLKSDGTLKVLAKYLSLNYLWEKIRVQGGAYGTGLQIGESGNVFFYSYRDPNGAESLKTYEKTPEFMDEAFSKEQDITGVILGTLGDESPLRSARMQGAFADSQELLGISYEEEWERRKEILSATPEKLSGLSGLMRKMLACGNICVAGGAAQLQACGIGGVEKL